MQKQHEDKQVRTITITDDTKLKQLAINAGKVAGKIEETQVDEDGQILLGAADWFEEHEWCTGQIYQCGAACALGGIYIAKFGEAGMHNDYLTYDVLNIKELQGAIKRLGNYVGCPDVYEWNDEKASSKDGVINALREAAKLK